MRATVIAGRKTADNPKASEKAIMAWIKKRKPGGLVVLNHPNCPLDVWWRLAAIFPREALRSPAAPLMLMEPARWYQMERESVGDWIEAYLPRLSIHENEALAADFLTHVLPIYERLEGKDSSVREMVAIRRRYAQGEIYLGYFTRELDRIHNHHPRPVYEPAHLPSREIRHAAYCNQGNVARLIGVLTAKAVSLVENGAGDAWFLERHWQWERLNAYLDRAVPPMPAVRGVLAQHSVPVVAGRKTINRKVTP